jgi:hypothetical protein
VPRFDRPHILDAERRSRDGRRGHGWAPVTVLDPPTFGAGPCATQELAKREAARANEHNGGPGFFVETEDGDVIRRPHAYFAERSRFGQWYAVLKEMPQGHVAGL